jgi:hypothetical protein
MLLLPNALFEHGHQVIVGFFGVSVLGKPLSALQVMEEMERPQLHPDGLFPAPESQESKSCGPKPERPGLVLIGMLSELVPVTGLAVTFSPIPLMAASPLSSDMTGRDEDMLSVLAPWALSPMEPANPSVPAGIRHGPAEDRSVPFMSVSPCYRLLPCKLLSQPDINQVR